MSLIKVSEATNDQLDWLVAKVGGLKDRIGKTDVEIFHICQTAGMYTYSTDWSQGGPIIERERISTQFWVSEDSWEASIKGGFFASYGLTPLIAAMRCYVISKLGNSVEVPDDLIGR